MYTMEHGEETAARQYQDNDPSGDVSDLLQHEAMTSHAPNIYHVYILKQEPQQQGISEPEPHLQEPAQKQRHMRFPGLVLALWLIGSALVMGTGAGIGVSLWFPLSSVTVTIIPMEYSITTTTRMTLAGQPQLGTYQLKARRLPALTLSQERTVNTTGRGYQPAIAAHGSITFYNAAPLEQTIPAGTLLISTSGIQVVTDATATIPAASMPMEGQTNIPAHTVQTGMGSNIPAYALSGACCRVNVFVRNNAAFTGGQDARFFPMVTAYDSTPIASSLKTSVTHSIQAAYQAQLKAGEGLVSFPCAAMITLDHPVGSEATTVTITVSETCNGFAYTTAALQQYVREAQTQQAEKHLGIGYILVGALHIALQRVTPGKQVQSSTLTVQSTGLWRYQFSPAQLYAFPRLLAGKTRQQATTLLLQTKDISKLVFGDTIHTLPTDATNIHVVVLYETSS